MINKQKIYIAGPYSKGDTINNIGYAIQIGNLLLERGFIPFIPHLTGFWHLMFPHEYETWMMYDREWLKTCDAVLRLPGQSSGADEEIKLAQELGIPVILSLIDLEPFFQEHN